MANQGMRNLARRLAPLDYEPFVLPGRVLYADEAANADGPAQANAERRENPFITKSS